MNYESITSFIFLKEFKKKKTFSTTYCYQRNLVFTAKKINIINDIGLQRYRNSKI